VDGSFWRDAERQLPGRTPQSVAKGVDTAYAKLYGRTYHLVTYKEDVMLSVARRYLAAKEAAKKRGHARLHNWWVGIPEELGAPTLGAAKNAVTNYIKKHKLKA
jgi:hypothetical protein